MSWAATVSRQRFEREAQAIASLRSPHTVDLFDFGVAQDGTFYYAMELLEGLDADTLVRRFGPVVPERVIYLLQQVCHSLAEAESYGLVHRDIKPANIFLCRYGIEYDFVKALDFGLVKSLDDGAWDRRPTPALTKDTVIQGTPAFMAPEQALGGVALDVRADIYATGCVAYWLLTGQVPFTADTAMGILLHHAGTTPTPPSSRSALSIPDALDQLVLSCLAKNPADRPQTASELAQRLADIPSAHPWSQDRAREWWVGHEGPAPWRRDRALSSSGRSDHRRPGRTGSERPARRPPRARRSAPPPAGPPETARRSRRRGSCDRAGPCRRRGWSGSRTGPARRCMG